MRVCDDEDICVTSERSLDGICQFLVGYDLMCWGLHC